MTEFPLTDETRALLARLRTQPDTFGVGDASQAEVEAVLREACIPVMNRVGLRMVMFNLYRMFIRELARLVRTRDGMELASELGVLLQKWRLYGLDPGLLQELVNAAWHHLPSGLARAAP